eukprot:4511099-Pyramimonas_sp.AAC.1
MVGPTPEDLLCEAYNTQHTWVRRSPNSSSFCLSGVVDSTSPACWMEAWITPISVFMPMVFTTARHCPFFTAVPEKSMLCFACASYLLAQGPGPKGREVGESGELDTG